MDSVIHLLNNWGQYYNIIINTVTNNVLYFDNCEHVKGPSEARRFVEDFVISQLQGEELRKILHFDYPDKVLENIFTIQGKEKPVAR